MVSSILQRVSAASGSSIRLQPVTLLEGSRHFFPETYTVECRVPNSCMTVIAAYEQSRSATAAINVYKLLYLRSPRHWLWLTLFIEIPSTSKYWPVVKTQSGTYRRWQTPIFTTVAQLPSSLNARLLDYFHQRSGIEDATGLNLSLSNDNTIHQNSLDTGGETVRVIYQLQLCNLTFHEAPTLPVVQSIQIIQRRSR